MIASSMGPGGSSLPPFWPRRPTAPSATRASLTFTCARPATTAISVASTPRDAHARTPNGGRRADPIGGPCATTLLDVAAGIAGQAPHDLALHIVGEQAAVVGEIKSDLAICPALLSGRHGVNDPAPYRLASACRGLDRRRPQGVVRIAKCAHDGLVFQPSCWTSSFADSETSSPPQLCRRLLGRRPPLALQRKWSLQPMV